MSVSSTPNLPAPMVSGTVLLTMSRVQSRNERETKKRIQAGLGSVKGRYEMRSRVALQSWFEAEDAALKERYGLTGGISEQQAVGDVGRYEVEKRKLAAALAGRGSILAQQLQAMEATMKALAETELNPALPPTLAISLFGVDMPLYTEAFAAMNQSTVDASHSVAALSSYVCTSVLPNACITFEHPLIATGLGSLSAVGDLVRSCASVGERLMSPLLECAAGNASSFDAQEQHQHQRRTLDAAALTLTCEIEAFKMLLGASTFAAGAVSSEEGLVLDRGLLYGSPLRPSTVHPGALDPTHLATRLEDAQRRSHQQHRVDQVPNFDPSRTKSRLLVLLQFTASNLVILVRSNKVKEAIASVFTSNTVASVSGAQASRDFALAAAPLFTMIVTTHVAAHLQGESTTQHPHPRAEHLCEVLWPYFEKGDAIILGEIQGAVKCPSFEIVSPNLAGEKEAAVLVAEVTAATNGEKRPREGGPEVASASSQPLNLFKEMSLDSMLTSGARWLLMLVNSTVNVAAAANNVDINEDSEAVDEPEVASSLSAELSSSGGIFTTNAHGIPLRCFARRASGIPAPKVRGDSAVLDHWRKYIALRTLENHLDASSALSWSDRANGDFSYTLVSDVWDRTDFSGCSRPVKMIRVKRSVAVSSPLCGFTLSPPTFTPSPTGAKVTHLATQFSISVFCAEVSFAKLLAAKRLLSSQQSEEEVDLQNRFLNPSSVAMQMWSNRAAFLTSKYNIQFSEPLATVPQSLATNVATSVLLHQVNSVILAIQTLRWRELTVAAAPSAGGVQIAEGQRFSSQIRSSFEGPFQTYFTQNLIPTSCYFGEIISDLKGLPNTITKLSAPQLERVLDQQRSHCCPASVVDEGTLDVTSVGAWVPNPVFRGFCLSSSESDANDVDGDTTLMQALAASPKHGGANMMSQKQQELSDRRKEIELLREKQKQDHSDDAQDMLHKVMQTTSNTLMASALTSGTMDDAFEIAPPENVLFVCKLSPLTTAKGLATTFSQFGRVVACDVITMPAGAREMSVTKQNYDAGNVSPGGGVVVGGQVRVNSEGRKSAKYAFVEFDSVDGCNAAFSKMEGVIIDDSRIHVDFSQSTSQVLLQELQHQRRKNVAPITAPSRTGISPSSSTADSAGSMLSMLRNLPQE